MSWTQNAQKWQANTERELERIMLDYAQMATAWMQINARWQNRTYRARHGLIAFPVRKGSVFGIVMGYNANVLNPRGEHYPEFLETIDFSRKGRLNIVYDSPAAEGAATVFTRQVIKELQERFA
jgi:hypothetical protein